MVETSRERYRKDSDFARLVDHILVYLERKKEVNPSELVEALALARAIYERHKKEGAKDESALH